MRRILILTLLILAAVCPVPVHPARAAGVSVTPAVLDLKAKARDIIQASVTIRNDTGHQARVYPIVNNVETRDGERYFLDPSQADLSASLANWVMFPRGGVELVAGESRRIDFEIRVDLTAKPGVYHANIAFPEGGNLPDAETRALSAGDLTINMEVEEDRRDVLTLTKFVADHRINTGSAAGFTYEVENTGNKPEVPQGELLIYDGSGKELGSIKINNEGYTLAPGEKRAFSALWKGRGFGRYKAMLYLSYAESGRLTDTVFFWWLPWTRLLLLALLTLALLALGAWWFERRYERWRISSAAVDGRGVVGGLTSHGIPHVVDLRRPNNLK